MRVASLTLTKFYQWRKVPLVMGDGLTFVVGKNGSGKSSLGVEAVSWIIWKKLIRGGKDKGFVADGTFIIEGNKYRIARGKDLLFEQVGEGGGLMDLAGQTPTQTQEKILAVFGSWETYVATHVFSGQRAKTFGGSTNASRQEILLDLMPELTKFDKASAMARLHVKEAEGELQTIHVASERAQAVLTEVKEQLEQAYANQQDVAKAKADLQVIEGSHADLKAQGETLDTKVGKLRKIHQEATGDAATARQALGDASAALRGAQESRGRFLHLGAECPACYQEVPPAHRKTIGLGLDETTATTQAKKDEADVAYNMLATEASDAAAAVDRQDTKARAMRTEVGDALARLTRAAQVVKEAEASQREVDKFQGRLADLQKEANTKSDAEGDLTEVLIRVRAVAEVLGPKGVRVGLMQDQLQFLAAAACDVLVSLGSGIRVHLSTSKAKADGTGTPTVNVKVTVDGGIYDYAELSAGERVRLDVAFLLALAKMGGPGFLTFDEVFDPLDEEGLEGVANLLQEMARDRQIVVVSHNPRLASLMPRGAVWRVEREPGGPSQLLVG